MRLVKASAGELKADAAQTLYGSVRLGGYRLRVEVRGNNLRAIAPRGAMFSASSQAFIEAPDAGNLLRVLAANRLARVKP
jgi:hypothetical protein